MRSVRYRRPAMTPLAPHLTAFFQERLTLERQASINTCDSYAYAFKLLLNFASKRLKAAPSRLAFEQLDAPLVVAFLNDLESKRSNAASSRNVRLAAIRSFMRFMEYRAPSALEQIQRVLAIPMKKTDTRACPAPQHGRDPGASGCAYTDRLARHPRSRHVALVLR